jgi:5'-deoxynucleotidase YfbR-like HD superfamily hydrolase
LFILCGKIISVIKRLKSRAHQTRVKRERAAQNRRQPDVGNPQAQASGQLPSLTAAGEKIQTTSEMGKIVRDIRP